MRTKHTQSADRLPETPSLAARRNRRKGLGAALVSGALVLSMCPAIALAQPGDQAGASNQGAQPQMSQQFAMPQGGMQQGSMSQGGMSQNETGGAFMQQPPAMQNNQAPEQNQGYEGNAQQPPSGDANQNEQMGQPGQEQGFQQNGQQMGQQDGQQDGQQMGQPGQPGDQGQMGQPGQQDGQQMGQPGQMGQDGQMPPMAPEQVRNVIERVYSILGIDAEAHPIDQVMDKLGLGRPSMMEHMFDSVSQAGQQMGIPGMPGQPGQSGQPGQTGQPGQPGGGSSNAPTSYDAANRPESSADGSTYNSSAGNENAVLVDGKTLTLSHANVDKTGDASGEDADFYGINAAILANNGANLTITDTTVNTNGAHANGVFSYGAGTTINIADSTITTSGNNSGGLMTTGGASMNATNLTVNTSGNSSAAIRTDRGGGTVAVTQGSYSTSGVGSPAIYSTADVTVNDATLSAQNSEAVVIEGGNSVTLNNASVTGSNAKLNGQSTIKTNVLIYQSMSGDASEGASSFTMTGGSLTSLTGSMFHVTNTTTTIDLSGVVLANAADSNDFLIATADSWGTAGKNGGHATVNLSSQSVSGNITVDSVSSVALNLKGSSYTGAISNEGTVDVTMDANSTWTLTGDSYISSLSGDVSGINLNGYKLYVNGSLYNA